MPLQGIQVRRDCSQRTGAESRASSVWSSKTIVAGLPIPKEYMKGIMAASIVHWFMEEETKLTSAIGALDTCFAQ